MAALIAATIGLSHSAVKAAAIIVDSSNPVYHDNADSDNEGILLLLRYCQI